MGKYLQYNNRPQKNEENGQMTGKPEKKLCQNTKKLNLSRKIRNISKKLKKVYQAQCEN